MLDDAYEHVHCFPIRSGHPLRPEEGLALAVLEDAVRTLQRYAVADNRAGRMLVAEVDAWFACNDTDHPFAFVCICDVLGLDVAYVRSGLRDWRESQLVALRTEPGVLHFTGHRRPRERVDPAPRVSEGRPTARVVTFGRRRRGHRKAEGRAAPAHPMGLPE